MLNGSHYHTPKWVPLSHSHSSCVPTTQCQGLFCILFLLCILSMDDVGLDTHSSLDWQLGFRDVVLICILEVVGFLWMSGHWHRVKLICGKHSGKPRLRLSVMLSSLLCFCFILIPKQYRHP